MTSLLVASGFLAGIALVTFSSADEVRKKSQRASVPVRNAAYLLLGWAVLTAIGGMVFQ